MIDAKRIKHLRAVVEYPTVQAAADALHITQSALTKSIARFEEDLGAPLFDRSGRRLVLTEIGERLVEQGESLLRQIVKMEEEVELWKGLGTGEVNIGVDPEAEFDLLQRVLEQFVPGHPNISISLKSGHTEKLLPDLLSTELHFVVADDELAQDHSELECTSLVTTPLAAALRPGHPLESVERPSPEDLTALPRLGASTAPRFHKWKMEHTKQRGGEPTDPSLITDNYEMLARLAERSDGVLFGPLRLLETYEQQGRLKVVQWPLEGPAIETSLIRIKERQLSPACERIIELLMQAASEERESAVSLRPDTAGIADGTGHQ